MEQLVARNIVAIVTALGILVVVGLGFVIRSGSLSATEAQDLVTIAQGLQKAYSNQGYQYGSGTIDPVILINGGKVDPSIVANGTTIQSRWQTNIVLTGNGSGFSASMTGIPYNNCTDLMQDQTLAQYVATIGISSGTMRQPPVSPANAAADCGGSGTQSLTVNFQGHP